MSSGLSIQPYPPGTSSRISPWVTALCNSHIPAHLDHDPKISGAPVLASVSKGVPGIFMDCHMMVSQPEKVRRMPLPLGVYQLTPTIVSG